MTRVLATRMRFDGRSWRILFREGSARRVREPVKGAKRATETMKATTLLERHHRNLNQLCETVEQGSASIRESLLPQLAGDLLAHLAVEAQVFYPAILEVIGKDAIVVQSRMRQRHGRATDAIREALATSLDSHEFERVIRALKVVIEVHAQEEEEALFPRIERALDAEESRALAREMMRLYHSKVEEGCEGARTAFCDPAEAAAP
jgi:iron-sulfur cluster repair protein YtfE (RIC family)